MVPKVRRAPLTGLKNNACPECGKGFDPEDPSSYRTGPRRQRLARGARLLAAIGLVSMIWFWLWITASPVLGASYFASPLTYIASIVGLAVAAMQIGRSRVVAAAVLVIGFWYGRMLYKSWYSHRPLRYAARVVHEGMTPEEVRDALDAFSQRPWSVRFYDRVFFVGTERYDTSNFSWHYVRGGTGRGFHDNCALWPEYEPEYEDGVRVRIKIVCPDGG